MSLPSIQYPIYEVNLTSRGLTKFRPFLVKEQKLLMMAVESKDLDTSVKAIKQVISACVLDKIDVDSLPMIDLEMLFLHLRARSMGEVMSVYHKCENLVDDKKCNMVMETEINLLDIKPELPNTDLKIALSDKVGVQMHYPSFDIVDLLAKANNSTEAEFIAVAGCIDFIYDENQVHDTDDASPTEVMEFVEKLSGEHYEKLRDFVLNAPTVKKEFKKVCPRCNYEHNLVLEGIQDFFT